jgi:hypothetical protein
MTIELFMYLFTIGSAANSLITQAVKKAFEGVPSNILALVSAVIVGVVASVFAYAAYGVTYSLTNVLCIPMMCVCIWIGSMLGYDKVLQTLKQIRS